MTDNEKKIIKLLEARVVNAVMNNHMKDTREIAHEAKHTVYVVKELIKNNYETPEED